MSSEPATRLTSISPGAEKWQVVFNVASRRAAGELHIDSTFVKNFDVKIQPDGTFSVGYGVSRHKKRFRIDGYKEA